MRKKILFVITKSNFGGAQRYVYDLATSLPRDAFDPIVAFGGAGARGAAAGLLKERLDDSGIPTRTIRAFARDIHLISECRAFFELLKLYRALRPDAIHLNSSKAGGIGALAGRFAGVPRIIFTSHGLAYDEDRNSLARMLIFLSTWATFLLCHAVILLSDDTYARARKLPFVRGKVHRIYNGIGDIDWYGRAEARARITAQSGGTTPRAGVWIGTISELTRNKGLSFLIEGAALATRAGHHFTLYIIGDGEEQEQLRAQTRALGLEESVRFLGYIPEAYRYLPAFDIVTLTSVKEGLPYVLLETGKAGRAVLASRIPGITDIIEDGTSGLLTEPRDVRDIAAKMIALIENEVLRNTLSSALQTRVHERFSIERMMRDTVQLYR